MLCMASCSRRVRPCCWASWASRLSRGGKGGCSPQCCLWGTWSAHGAVMVGNNGKSSMGWNMDRLQRGRTARASSNLASATHQGGQSGLSIHQYVYGSACVRVCMYVGLHVYVSVRIWVCIYLGLHVYGSDVYRAVCPVDNLSSLALVRCMGP